MRKKHKTKFPVARIKKIMQMDEDVGKMAQATPVLVAKSLEMFMQSLIDRSCEETRFRNSKRMSSAHLKRCINANEQFDFLKDVVAAVPDLPDEMSVHKTAASAELSPVKTENGASTSPMPTTATASASADPSANPAHAITVPPPHVNATQSVHIAQAINPANNGASLTVDYSATTMATTAVAPTYMPIPPSTNPVAQYAMYDYQAPVYAGQGLINPAALVNPVSLGGFPANTDIDCI
ncbi:hypothetical protein H4R33_003517 [Dimargaris cristalligena]|nr:hypothetical protein H4R33_003517 [Dimargaris cristalligena]